MKSRLILLQQSEDDDDFSEEEDEEEIEEMEDVYDSSYMESPFLETDLVDQEVEDSAAIRQEEFAEVDGGKGNIEEELTDKKVEETILPLLYVEHVREIFSLFFAAFFCLFYVY